MTKNGWVADVPDNVYHDGDGLSSSDLKLLNRSPMHFNSKVQKDSPTFAFGRAFHCAVLEPNRYIESVAIIPDVDRRTKKGKEEYLEWADTINDGAIILTESDHDKIGHMRESIDHNASEYFTDGHAELSGYYWSKSYSEMLKIRPDYILDDAIIDVKTCVDARESAVTRSIYQYDYHLSAAYYMDVANMIEGNDKIKRFIWVFIEKEYPYGVTVCEAHESLLEMGRDKVTNALEMYKHCSEAGEWEGYSNEVITIYGA